MNKQTKRFLALLFAAMMLLSVSLAEENTAAEAISPDDVILTVNGQDVKRSALDYYADYYYQFYTEQGYDMSGAENQSALSQIALNLAVQDEVVVQKAKELGFYPTDAEVEDIRAQQKEQWDSYAMMVATYIYGYSEEATEEENAAALENANTYMQDTMGYGLEQIVRMGILSNVYNRMFEIYTGDCVLEEGAVDKAFQEQCEADQTTYEGNSHYYEYYVVYQGQTSYYTPAGFRRVKQILLSVDDTLLQDYLTKSDALKNGTEGTTQMDVDAAHEAIIASVQGELNDIYASFQTGTAFDELIEKYNTDPGMMNEPGKTEGYMVCEGSIIYDPAFTEAAMSIDAVGGISQPSIGQYGIYICYYLKEAPAGFAELTDDIRAQLEQDLLNDMKNSVCDQLITEWTGNAEIIMK